jgi:hypothetical protein
MSTHHSDIPALTRRDFVRAGIATAGTLALGGCVRNGAPRDSVTTAAQADLDALARKIHGRFLRDGSPLFDEARTV